MKKVGPSPELTKALNTLMNMNATAPPIASDVGEPPTLELKSWMQLYDAIASGAKLHDIREKNLGIKIGDKIRLRRFDFTRGQYTGESLIVLVTYITDNDTPCAFSSAVLDRDYQILSIKVIE